LLLIYNKIKKVIRVQGENENHELQLPEISNDVEIFTNANTPRVEELEKDVKKLKKWKEAVSRVYLKSKRQ
jgi:hypothetical protein